MHKGVASTGLRIAVLFNKFDFSVIKCCDDPKQYLIRHNRRDHAGVAVIWDITLDPIIQPEMEDGNERIIVIEVQCSHYLCVFTIRQYPPQK